MPDDANLPAPQGEFLIYQTEDGHTRVQVRFERDTVWLSQRDMTELFQTSKQNVSLHIQNVFDEGELVREGTVKEYLTVQTEGNRQVERRVEHYNLDVIISVGYRVKSLAVPSSASGPHSGCANTSLKASRSTTSVSNNPAAATTTRNCSNAFVTSAPPSGSSGEKCSTSMP